MGQLQLTGALTAGPASSFDGFPSMTASSPLQFMSTTKPSNVCSGSILRQVASPGSFVALTGVGAADTVTKADFLMLQTNSPLTIRKTIGDGAGGTTTVTETIHGLVVQEFASGYELQMLEAKGTSACQYLVSGQR